MVWSGIHLVFLKVFQMMKTVKVKCFLSHSQSIRVTVFSAVFAFSITMMAHKHRRNHTSASLETQSQLGGEAISTLRRLLSEPSNTDQNDPSKNKVSVEEIIPVNDPDVIEVEKFLRKAFNEERRSNCAAFKSYVVPGHLQFAKSSKGKGDSAQYSLEVDFGDVVVFARIAEGKGKSKYTLLSSIPNPCDAEMVGQLAVSNAGASINKFQYMLRYCNLISRFGWQRLRTSTSKTYLGLPLLTQSMKD
jgi:hypothetical protein